MMVKSADGEETFGNLTKSSVKKILDDYKDKERIGGRNMKLL